MEKYEPAFGQVRPQEGNRERAKAQSLAPVILDNLASHRHRRESHLGLIGLGRKTAARSPAAAKTARPVNYLINLWNMEI